MQEYSSGQGYSQDLQQGRGLLIFGSMPSGAAPTWGTHAVCDVHHQISSTNLASTAAMASVPPMTLPCLPVAEVSAYPPCTAFQCNAVHLSQRTQARQLTLVATAQAMPGDARWYRQLSPTQLQVTIQDLIRECPWLPRLTMSSWDMPHASNSWARPHSQQFSEGCRHTCCCIEGLAVPVPLTCLQS